MAGRGRNEARGCGGGLRRQCWMTLIYIVTAWGTEPGASGSRLSSRCLCSYYSVEYRKLGCRISAGCHAFYICINIDICIVHHRRGFFCESRDLRVLIEKANQSNYTQGKQLRDTGVFLLRVESRNSVGHPDEIALSCRNDKAIYGGLVTHLVDFTLKNFPAEMSILCKNAFGTAVQSFEFFVKVKTRSNTAEQGDWTDTALMLTARAKLNTLIIEVEDLKGELQELIDKTLPKLRARGVPRPSRAGCPCPSERSSSKCPPDFRLSCSFCTKSLTCGRYPSQNRCRARRGSQGDRTPRCRCPCQSPKDTRPVADATMCQIGERHFSQ